LACEGVFKTPCSKRLWDLANLATTHENWQAEKIEFPCRLLQFVVFAIWPEERYTPHFAQNDFGIPLMPKATASMPACLHQPRKPKQLTNPDKTKRNLTQDIKKFNKERIEVNSSFEDTQPTNKTLPTLTNITNSNNISHKLNTT
jgi:hypothetical protein